MKISTEAIIVTDVNGQVVLFSPGAEQTFRCRASDAIGRSIEALMPARLKTAHAQHLRGFRDGEPESILMGARAPIVGLRSDGEEFPLEASVSKVHTPEGTIFTVILHDVSERQQVERALLESAEAAEAANQAKSAFLATMSHEIRTPLNGVLGMAQVMSNDTLSDAQRDRLDVIRESGEALLAILNDVLDLSKIESGKLELEDVEFDLAELVHGAQATFTSLANKAGLSFALDVTQAEGSYRGDPTRVRQVLYNLISNALKFTENGEVRVTATYDAGRLRLSVADTGVGMSAEFLSTLFTPFKQADSSTTRRFGGTGLGLAISRHLAELMGGALEAESTAGSGSVFTLSLPLTKVKEGRTASNAPPAPQPATSLGARSARVLAAEDNPTNQLVLKTLLHQAGLEPVVVENGQLALEAWEAGAFDLILMDVQMPVLDGPGATAAIRRRELETGRARTPIIALTANAMAHQRALYLDSGMDRVVTKPIDVASLFEAIEDALGG
jgi:PAS domain S-box-containing protein